MSAELAIRCAEGETLADLLKLTIVNADDGTAYIDCDNKDESLESILKRCIVVLDDGTYAIQVYDVSP